MLERGSGTVVMVSSRLGQIGCSGLAHYSAAKAGLLGLVKSLARELAPRGGGHHRLPPLRCRRALSRPDSLPQRGKLHAMIGSRPCS
ncbi:MAG: SDR family NAD(P)-dependent oxidoreductase [Acidimicrobiia bacterium]